MSVLEALREMLLTDYGIASTEDLVNAIRKQGRVDISVFCKEATNGKSGFVEA